MFSLRPRMISFLTSRTLNRLAYLPKPLNGFSLFYKNLTFFLPGNIVLSPGFLVV